VIGWLVRLIFILTGLIAGWFVAKDSPNFSAVQLVVGLSLMFLIVLIVVVVAHLKDIADKGAGD
jgi:nitrogen fixation/metabolism regulation signal transduction histidine kinase